MIGYVYDIDIEKNIKKFSIHLDKIGFAFYKEKSIDYVNAYKIIIYDKNKSFPFTD